VTVGSTATKLILLRGPSGSGKTTVAASLRAAYGRGIAVIPQDMVRREILRERDHPGGVNITLIDTMARHILDQGVHVVLEGILDAVRYGQMLTSLLSEHVGDSYGYFFDIPFEATLERHRSKPNRDEWTEADMREWYRDGDLLPDAGEQIIGPDSTLEETVQRILAETQLCAAVRPAHSGFGESAVRARA
jgi:adenylate kinase family enzyme